METERTDTFRILDAAANRVREGLRVAEDYARFVLDDGHISRLLKELRHELAGRLAGFEASGMIAARDTLRDVGTEISTATEAARGVSLDVVRANLRRAEEGLRTLEEFGKLLDPVAATEFGRLRYRAYTLEKAILAADSARERLAGCDLCLLLTAASCSVGVERVAREALAAGVRMIQVREKSLADDELLEHARRVREWIREAGALLIVNDRPDVAALADADGVHLGQDDLPVREARRIVGPRRLIGVSTHDIEQARQAVLDGADYLGVGPTFPSGTKEFAAFAGIDFVRAAAAEISLPWFAIGGIGPENLGDVLATGATRVAVSAAICAAEDPAGVARRMLDRLGS
ncbi:MAG: thiamine phosphate synthase [Planctomycetales bacterium]